MRPSDLLLPVLAIILLAGAFLFFSAKNPMRKAVLTNKEGGWATLDVEIADNLTSRARGLMGRSSLPEDSGMLFIFDKPGRHSFWMLNTTIPLDAVHIAPDGTILQIIQMEPCGINPLSCPSYLPANESLYVLEVNKGYCDRHSIAPGGRFRLI